MNPARNFTLNFHAIYNTDFDVHPDPVFAIHETKLHLIFSAIRKSGKDIRITFDDGHLSDATLALPALRKYQLSATFFVLGQSLLDNPLKWEQTRMLHNAGFKIGSHGYSHRDLTQLNAEELEIEIGQAKAIIEDCIGDRISDFALPMGKTNATVNAKIKAAGFAHIYTTKGYASAPGNLLIHRLNIKSSTGFFFLKKAVINQQPVYKIRFGIKMILKNTIQRF